MNGGTENDCIIGNPGAMQMFGSDGADTVDLGGSSAQTVVGGNDFSDGADTIRTGSGAPTCSSAMAATTRSMPERAADTLIGGFGNDSACSEAIGRQPTWCSATRATTPIVSGPVPTPPSAAWATTTSSMRPGAAAVPRWFGNEGNDTVDGARRRLARPLSAATTRRTAPIRSSSAPAPTGASATAAATRSAPGNGNNTVVGGFGSD